MSEKFAGSMSEMPAIGLPDAAPQRPAAPAAFPPVYDRPPGRDTVTLTSMEQRQLENDLLQARDRQQASAGVSLADRKKVVKRVSRNPAPSAQAPQAPAAQASKDRASNASAAPASSRTIY